LLPTSRATRLSLNGRATPAPSAAASKAAPRSSHSASHPAHQRHHHCQRIVRAPAPESSHASSAHPWLVLALRHHCELAALKQGIIPVFGFHSALFIGEFNVRNPELISTLKRHLPKGLLRVRVLANGHANDLATLFEVFGQSGLIC
jgi:hypothetical protein